MGELEPAGDVLPQSDRGIPPGRIDEHRTEEGLSVREHQCRYAEPSEGNHRVVFGAHFVAGGGIVDGHPHQPRVETELSEQLLGHFGTVRLLALDVERVARGLIPPVEEIAVSPSEQGTDAHHRPAIGPLPFPRVLLTFGPVDLFETEEAPPHLDAGRVTNFAYPQR